MSTPGSKSKSKTPEPAPASDPNAPVSSRGAPVSSRPGDRRIAVVVNGNAKSVTEEVITTLDQILAGSDLFVSRRIEEAQEIARILVDRGYGTVLTGGGDGTFTVMVSAVVKEADHRGVPRPRFGLLRLGTGNSLAWLVGASRAKGGGLAADIHRLRQDAGSRLMRLIEVEGQLTPFCGSGIDAVVLRDHARTKQFLCRGPVKRWIPGPLTYAVAATTQSIPSYLFRPVPHCRVINQGADAYRVTAQGSIASAPIRAGEVIYEGRARIVACSTIPYYGFGFRMFPFAEDRPDRMHLRISTISPWDFVTNFPAIFRGEYESPERLFDYLVEDITVQMDPETPFQIGGDPQGLRTEVPMRLQPEPIRLVDYYAPPRG